MQILGIWYHANLGRMCFSSFISVAPTAKTSFIQLCWQVWQNRMFCKQKVCLSKEFPLKMDFRKERIILVGEMRDSCERYFTAKIVWVSIQWTSHQSSLLTNGPNKVQDIFTPLNWNVKHGRGSCYRLKKTINILSILSHISHPSLNVLHYEYNVGLCARWWAV